MTTYMLHVQETEQKFPIPPEIGIEDNLVKRALAGVIPYIDSAKLERSEQNGVITIKVTKTHAPKGAGDPGSSFFPFLECLIKSKSDGRNPVIGLFLEVEAKKRQIYKLQPHEVLELDQKITNALEAGEELERQIKYTLSYLVQSPPLPAREVPTGF